MCWGVILMKSYWSICDEWNPKDKRSKCNFSNQALGVCFRPYNALCSLHTMIGNFESTNPGGCTKYTSSTNSPIKKGIICI